MAARGRLKSRILKMLKEDEEFRYAVAGLIGLEEILKRLDKHDAEIAKLREDMIKGFERHDRELERLSEDMMRGSELMDKRITRLENLISTLGARWGIMAEDAFREGLRGILEK